MRSRHGDETDGDEAEAAKREVQAEGAGALAAAGDERGVARAGRAGRSA